MAQWCKEIKGGGQACACVWEGNEGGGTSNQTTHNQAITIIAEHTHE